VTDYDKGWAKDAQPAPGPSREFPPDQPPTRVYGTYPKFYIPPFHFANPVTGRSPQYPEGTVSARLRSDHPADNSVRPARSIEELKKNIAETERLLRTAVAYDAAENLASAYGYYLDEFMWDETADLFTIDAVRDFAAISIETGRENIRQSLKRRYPGKKATNYFTAHQLVQPVIHVAADGESTNVRVRLFQLGGASGGSGLWIAGIYECRTAIEDRVWKFKAMDLDYIWTADYKGGWSRVTADSKGFVAAPFPKIVDLPFHYRNPVSGRTPPVFVQ